MSEQVRNQTNEVVVFVLINVRLRASTSIHENISLSAMTMEVTVKKDSMIYCTGFCMHFGVVDRWVKQLRWISPSPVQVSTKDVTPIVPINDSVRV